MKVTSGKLLKIWPAHQNPLSCLAFSHDGTLLISASEDGVIHVWSMIRYQSSETSATVSDKLLGKRSDCFCLLAMQAYWMLKILKFVELYLLYTHGVSINPL